MVHTKAREKEKMTPRKRQIAIANDKANELAKCGVFFLYGAHFAEQAAEDAYEVRQHIYAALKHAASFDVQVGDVVDMDKITEAKNTNGSLKENQERVGKTGWLSLL